MPPPSPLEIIPIPSFRLRPMLLAVLFVLFIAAGALVYYWRKNIDDIQDLITNDDLIITDIDIDTTISTLSAQNDPKGILLAAINIAKQNIGVMEQGNNAGEQVEAYLSSVGLSKGNPWCAAFVYWSFERAARSLNTKTPLPKTGSVLTHWSQTQGKKITAKQAQNDNNLIRAGQIFIIKTGKGTGHTGIIERIDGNLLTTIEGNSNNNGSREGVGVFRLQKRTIKSINIGFIDYDS
jgi:predicted nuclease of predicted toxin-antitoxin system